MNVNILITIIIILSLQKTNSQSISFGLYSDAKLLSKGDRLRGIPKGSKDLVFRFKMNGNQEKYGYLTVIPEFEYAEIDGNYRRYSANIGYTFNELILKNLEVTPILGYGWIDRYSVSTYSFGASLETLYNICEKMKIGFLHQFVERSDLEWLWGDSKLRYSFFIGIEIILN